MSRPSPCREKSFQLKRKNITPGLYIMNKYAVQWTPYPTYKIKETTANMMNICFFQILPRLKIINRLSSSKDPHQSRMKKKIYKSTMTHRKAESQFSNPQSDIRLLSRNGHSFPFKQEIRPPHPLQANN